MMGQLADKAHRITQQKRRILKYYFTGGGIQGGKEFVLGKYLCLTQYIHQSTLAYIGIAYQGYPYQLTPFFTLGKGLFVYFGQSLA